MAKLTLKITPQCYGAAADGVTDDTQAFTDAWNAAAASDHKHLYIPAGTYLLDSTSATFQLVSGMTVSGEGMHASIIKWGNDGDTEAPSILIGRTSGSATATDVTIRDFAIRGSHDSDYEATGKYPLLIYSVNGLRIQNISVSYSRVFGITVRNSFDVDVDGCVVHHCARDGINTANCNYVRICDNHVSFCDDDGIANHTQIYSVSDRGFVISGNILRFCQGIKCLGARSGAITGNTLEFCMGQGISITTLNYTGTELEGINPAVGVLISNNVIKNTIDRAFVDNLNSTAPYIRISGDADQAGSLDAIPGENDTNTGTIIDPYEYFENAKNGTNDEDVHANTPIPGSYSVAIVGNVCVRDIPDLTNISDLGFGEFYTRNGPVDPSVTSSSYLEEGVTVGNGIMKNVLIANNVFQGLSNAIGFSASAKLVSSRISNNLIYDCTGGIAVSGSNTLHQNVLVNNNTFDLDPFCKNANRGANGTFSANGGPTGILIQNSYGFTVINNVFKNLCRISDSVPSAGADKIQYLRNIVIGQPAALGFSTSNKGIGSVVRAGDSFIYYMVDSDPASSTYGDVLNVCHTDSNAMPSTGLYVVGHFVRNNTPTLSSGKVVLGWIRLTTGSNHVANTDWAALYATNS